LSVSGVLRVEDAKFEISAGSLGISAGANRALTVAPTGGTLHGTWSADQAVSTSDRRLKKSITPLYKAIAESSEMARDRSSGMGQRPAKSQKDSVVNWVLRELRPVSFTFKNGPEAKHSRYGFVAQELQQVLPDVVRKSEDSAEHLSVVYQDLIALLTLATQSLQEKMQLQESRLEKQHEKMQLQESRLEKQDKMLEKQSEMIEKLTRMFVELDRKLELRDQRFKDTMQQRSGESDFKETMHV
jgi:hypothetical protein